MAVCIEIRFRVTRHILNCLVRRYGLDLLYWKINEWQELKIKFIIQDHHKNENKDKNMMCSRYPEILALQMLFSKTASRTKGRFWWSSQHWVNLIICGNSERDTSYLGLVRAQAWKNLDRFRDVHQNMVGGKDMAFRSYNSLQNNFLSRCSLFPVVYQA